MTNLADAIRVLHPNAKFGSAAQGGDFVVIADAESGVQSIDYWNVGTLGAEPSLETLQAVVVPTSARVESKKRLVQAMHGAGTLAAFITARDAAKASDRERWSSFVTVPDSSPVLGRLCAAASPAIVISDLFDAAQTADG